jgi:hypothetical protein
LDSRAIGFVTGHAYASEEVKAFEDTVHDIELARAGDRDALRRILRAMTELVYPVARCVLPSRCEAERATRAIVIRLVTGLGSCAGSLHMWVYRVAAEHLLTHDRVIDTSVLDDIEYDAHALADELHALITGGHGRARE